MMKVNLSRGVQEALASECCFYLPVLWMEERIRLRTGIRTKLSQISESPYSHQYQNSKMLGHRGSLGSEESYFPSNHQVPRNCQGSRRLELNRKLIGMKPLPITRKFYDTAHVICPLSWSYPSNDWPSASSVRPRSIVYLTVTSLTMNHL